MTTCGVAETFHLQKTDLVKATSKDIYYVPVMGGPLGQSVVELQVSC